MNNFLLDCGGNLEKIAAVKGEKIICECVFQSSELISKLLKTKTFGFIFKKKYNVKEKYWKRDEFWTKNLRKAYYATFKQGVC